MSKIRPVKIQIDQIERIPLLQCRTVIDRSVIEEYREQVHAGVSFPPVEIVRVDGRLLLVDGFCRMQAYGLANKRSVMAIVTDGDMPTAIARACGANAHHGLRRTNDDKRKAVATALDAFADKSSREIANICAVSHTFVDRVKAAKRKAEQSSEQLAEQPAEQPPETGEVQPVEVATLPPSELVVASTGVEIAQESGGVDSPMPWEDAVETVTTPEELISSEVVEEVAPESVPLMSADGAYEAGEPCRVCSCRQYVETDIGFVCVACSQERDSPEINAIDLGVTDTEAGKKIRAAYGRFVRELEKAGCFSRLETVLEPVSLAVSSLKV